MKIRARLPLAAVAAATLLFAGACVPDPGGPPTTWTPGPCPTDTGVTVVVDCAELDDEVVVRCALGAQASGLAALTNAGFTLGQQAGAGSVCQIDSLPAEGYPYCWLTGGYWSYWRADTPGAEWGFAPTGPAGGPLEEGSVEGWAWAQDFASSGPSVSSDGS